MRTPSTPPAYHINSTKITKGFKLKIKIDLHTTQLLKKQCVQSGIVISFDNLDQNKLLTNRCTRFRLRDISW